MLTKDLAICIRATDYSETSQVLVFFTRLSGKISAIAKGSKRQKSAFQGPIELFASGRIVYTQAAGGGLATLTEFDQQGRFTHLSQNYYAMNCALFVAELMNNLTDEYDPHPELFDKLLQFFINGQHAETIEEHLSLLIFFQLSLLSEVGLQPILKNCVNCKRLFTQDWKSCYFSTGANGLLCGDCENNFPDRMMISNKIANCFSNLKSIAEADRKLLLDIEKLLISHLKQTLKRELKMVKYILKP